MQRVEETQEPEANNKLLTIGGRGWTSPLCTQQCPRPQDSEKAPGTTLQFASHSGLVLIREVGRHALALLTSRAGTRHRVNLAFAARTVEIHDAPAQAPRSHRSQVRMLYVGRLHNGTRPEVRHMRDARLEAGRLQRMRHARARLEIVVVSIQADPPPPPGPTRNRGWRASCAEACRLRAAHASCV